MMDEGWLPHRLNGKSGDGLRQCAQVYIEGAPEPTLPVIAQHLVDAFAAQGDPPASPSVSF